MARKFRSLILVAVLLLSFAVPSGNAYADGYAGVVYGPKATAVVNPEYGVIVNAGSSFDAALYAIGYSPDSSEFTADVKAYLSNADTGGAFYTFAQKFTNHNDKWGTGGFVAVGDTVGLMDFDLDMTTALKMFNNMYGPSNVWCGQYSAAERVAAVASVGLVLAGGVGGGGGSGGESDEGYYVFSGNTLSQGSSGASSYSAGYFSLGTSNKYSYYAKYINNPSYDNGFEIGPRTLTFRVPKSAMAQFETTYPSSEYDWVLDVTYRNGVFTYAHLQCYSQLTYKEGYTPFTDYSGISRADLSVNRRYTWQFTSLDQAAMTYSDNVVTFANDGDANRFTGANYSSSYVSFSTDIAVPLITAESPIPPTNWPESDPTPTPEPPTVDPPTTPDPPNVPTTPTPPTYPPEVTYPDVTYVEADLSAVLDALNEHCEHLQHSIYTASSNLYSSLSSSISGEFTSLKTFMRALMSWNVDAMNDNFDALYTYLDDFTSWLDSKLRFDDVILLLQAIYNGLPDSVDMSNTNALLQDIYNGMAELDSSTNDLVDLSTIESGISDISADVELIIQALNNLQDDNQLPTIRGYLKQIYDELDSLNLTVGAIVIPAGSDYTTVLQNIYDEISEYTNTFVQFWDDLRSYLDDILDALDNLEITPRVRYTPTSPPEIPDAPDLDADLNVDALRDALSRLMEKFPFSTINNFLLILTLLTRPARAPVFDLPLPNPSDWSSPYMVNVDLSIWDIPAAVLRTGIVIWAIARVSRRTVSMWTREEGGGQ